MQSASVRRLPLRIEPPYRRVAAERAVAGRHARALVVDGAAGGIIYIGERRGRVVRKYVVDQRHRPLILNRAAVGGDRISGKRRIADGQRAGIQDRAAVDAARDQAVLQVQVREHDRHAAIDLENRPAPPPLMVSGVLGLLPSMVIVPGPAEFELALRERDGVAAQAGVESDRVAGTGRRIGVGLDDRLPQGEARPLRRCPWGC